MDSKAHIREQLEAMKNVDIRTVDPDTLRDIREVSVDQKLPREERMAEFLRQIKNPYCFKCGKFTVKAQFSDDGVSLEDCLKQILM